MGMDLANWLQSLVLAAKDPCGMFLQKNSSLGELRYQKIIAFLMGDLLDSLSDIAHEENYRNKLCGGKYSEVGQGKRWQRRQIKPIDLVHFFKCFKCFNY